MIIIKSFMIGCMLELTITLNHDLRILTSCFYHFYLFMYTARHNCHKSLQELYSVKCCALIYISVYYKMNQLQIIIFE